MKNIAGCRLYTYPDKKAMLIRREDNLFFYKVCEGKIDKEPYSKTTTVEYLHGLERQLYACENEMDIADHKKLINFLS